MILVIRAHTLKNETLSQSITGHFDERGGTIGRSDTNTLALPDPERHISRLQAEVWFTNGSFSIRNVGSANAIVLNGRPINAGEGSTLGHADELVIGGYVMRATLATPDSAPRTDDRAPIDSRTVIKASAVESRTNPRLQLQPPAAPLPPAPPTPRSLGGTTAAMPPPAQPTPPRATPAPIDSANPFGDLLGGPSGPGASDPFADLMGGARDVNPGTVPSFRPAAAPVVVPLAPPPPAARAFAPPPPVAPPVAPPATASRLPDDFDPFADLPSPASGSAAADPLAGFMGSSASAPPPAPTGGSLPVDFSLGDLLGSPTAAPSSSLDAMFGLGNAPAASSGGDPLASFLAAPAPGGASTNTDPLAMFGAAPAAPAAAIPADFDHTPELRGAYVPPAVQAPPPPPAPPARPPVAPPPFDPNMTQVSAPRPPAPPRAAPPASRIRGDDLTPTTTMPGVRPARPSLMTSAPMPLTPMPPTPVAPPVAVPPVARPPVAAPAYAAGDTTPEALWAAFCEGAGIQLQPPQGLNPALMKVVGELLRHSVDGTLKLVAARAAAKQELRADVTMIQARNNNPLKFSPDAGAAIEQLLQPPMRGFMVGPAAVHDAMDDLLGHAIGTMVGMRAALDGVLKRFEPSQLEGKLSGSSVLDSVLPMNRRAKLWELYLQHYQRIHEDAQEDFHELFGKAFIKAYEDQLDRLDAERHPGRT